MIGDSKASRLALAIEDSIRTTPLSPGSFLGTKATLAQQHTVSGGTLNEVLRLLQVRGYVDVKPGPKGGAFVASRARRAALTHGLLNSQGDASHIATLIHVQDALEELVVVAAAKRCSRESAAAIGIALAALSQVSTPQAALTSAWALDAEIARATEDPVLIDLYCGILRALEESMEWPTLGDLAIDDTIRIHAEIAGAVMQNNYEAARLAARLHSPAIEED
jgi:DNA-binding FadR family transcriptional regulator